MEWWERSGFQKSLDGALDNINAANWKRAIDLLSKTLAAYWLRYQRKMKRWQDRLAKRR